MAVSGQVHTAFIYVRCVPGSGGEVGGCSWSHEQRTARELGLEVLQRLSLETRRMADENLKEMLASKQRSTRASAKRKQLDSEANAAPPSASTEAHSTYATHS